MRSIRAYLSHVDNKPAIESLAKECQRLDDQLTSTISDGPAVQRQHDHPYLKRVLYRTLRTHSECRSSFHDLKRPQTNQRWHPTWLSLEGSSIYTYVDILISTMEISSWQQFRLNL